MEEDNLELTLTSESDAQPGCSVRPGTRATKGTGTRSTATHAATHAATGSDDELLVAMRAGRSRALRAFYLRFRPVLLDQAYKLGVPPSEREEIVTEFLSDIALALINATSSPRALVAYIVTAFRHAVISRYRTHERRAMRHADAAADVAESAESAVVSLCSAYSLRAVRGELPLDETDGAEGETTSRGETSVRIDALAVRLLAKLPAADRELLTWIGERVPSTVIAAWRGTTANAVKVKISRIRARLRVAAGEYLQELDGPERAELERFFRRAGVMVTPPAVITTVTHGQVPMRADDGSPYGLEDA